VKSYHVSGRVLQAAKELGGNLVVTYANESIQISVRVGDKTLTNNDELFTAQKEKKASLSKPKEEEEFDPQLFVIKRMSRVVDGTHTVMELLSDNTANKIYSLPEDKDTADSLEKKVSKLNFEKDLVNQDRKALLVFSMSTREYKNKIGNKPDNVNTAAAAAPFVPPAPGGRGRFRGRGGFRGSN